MASSQSFFKISRSCRQGDPLSPYLFVLAVEPLAESIRKNQKIIGLKVKEKQIKIGQYDDDTFLMLNEENESFQESINTLRSFERESGLKMNLEKTQAIWVGDPRHKNKINQWKQLNWVCQFDLLGITFNVKQDTMIRSNFDKKIVDIDKTLNLYRKFNLSIIGKINVIKSLAIPKLVYLLTVLPTPPREVFDTIEKRFTDFIWDGNRVKVQKKQLEKTLKTGD